ncbi:hypothetical protein O181_062692 [Austropuccinia psidii MF-1]|uniref:Reverse transcriptase/retrotransposon-derived protein RNase H-like domain-containing protein n=1 Tax=Austropuccinia psidii MF-1 TaxID=1389203 RepID=A0A9Q3ESL6_9BASI|nr:hypothetical protein [Austropuccinia psidii MF-1]
MDHQILAAKYKSVLKNVRPGNEPMPQDLNLPLEIPTLSRDPYETPLFPNPPIFQETFKFTHERLQAVNFGPPGWLSNGEINLLRNFITLREKAIAFCKEERGLLKHSYGKPYKIPFTELIRERIRTGLCEQSTLSYTSPIFCVANSNGKLRIAHNLQELNKVTIKDAALPPHMEEFVAAFAGRACYGLVDIMGGYDERELDVTTRPLTTFETPL